MNTFKRYGLLLGALLTFACSGDPDGSNEQELGQLEQEIAVKFSSNFSYGVTTPLSHLACTPGNSGQSCVVPVKKKNLQWCNASSGANGLSSGDLTIFTNALAVVTASFPLWTFVHVPDGAACDTAHAGPDLNIYLNRAGSGACSGSPPSNNIDAYVCVNIPQGIALTESLPGNYFQGIGVGTTSIIHVDLDDLLTKAGAAGRDQALKNGFVHSILAVIGIGARTGGTAATYYSRREFTTVNTLGFSPGETCRASSFSSGDGTVFTQVTPGCLFD